jgi:molybdopterin-guanine dinucleotide biosynthesis protein A
VLLGDRTLVERATDALRARCREVVVVSRPGIRLPALAVPVVHDRSGPDCPLAALATGLAALGAEDALVLACDLPFAGPLLDALLAAPPGSCVAAAADGRPQPLCARYPRARALAAAERLLAAGALPARGLLDALGATTVAAEGDALLNVNTAADLERARMRLGRLAAPVRPPDAEADPDRDQQQRPEHRRGDVGGDPQHQEQHDH